MKRMLILSAGAAMMMTMSGCCNGPLSQFWNTTFFRGDPCATPMGAPDAGCGCGGGIGGGCGAGCDAFGGGGGFAGGVPMGQGGPIYDGGIVGGGFGDGTMISPESAVTLPGPGTTGSTLPTPVN